MSPIGTQSNGRWHGRRRRRCHPRGDITEKAARAAVKEAVLLPIETVPAAELVSHALELAMETGRTVYDCLYIAVAIAKGGIVLTADERLANGLRAGVFGRFVRWVGEVE